MCIRDRSYSIISGNDQNIFFINDEGNVIVSDGKLRGYGVGSDLLYIKEYLLAHEKKNN